MVAGRQLQKGGFALGKIRFDALEGFVGQEVAVSPWLQVPQALISSFADLTEDRNPIHLDPESARASGFERTVAHGYLLIALIPKLVEQCFEVPEGGKLINGALQWKFRKPVLSESSMRLQFKVLHARTLKGSILVKLGLAMEVSGNTIAGEGIVTFLCMM